MDALGFGDSPEGPQKEEGAAPRPARSKLDELLGRGTSPKLLERPQTGERKEFKLDPKYQKQPEKEDHLGGTIDFRLRLLPAHTGVQS
ncbi:hypothetical protein FKM82_019640 [Ascaphus truei]